MVTFAFADPEPSQFQQLVFEELIQGDRATPTTLDNADIIFCSERIDATARLLDALQKARNRESVTVFTTTEAVLCNFNLFDYCISMIDNKCEWGIQVHPVDAFKHWCPEVFDMSLESYPIWRQPRRASFNSRVDFIYSNDWGNHRDVIYSEFSKDFELCSYGQMRNNMDNATRVNWIGSWREEKLLYHQQCDASLAIENTEAPGYVTEKILTALEAGSVPLYFGAPDVGRFFNSAAFLSFPFQSHSRSEDSRTSKLLLHSNFEELVRQPVFTDHNLAVLAELRRQRTKFFDDLTTGVLRRRRPEGFAEEIHLKNQSRRVLLERLISTYSPRKFVAAFAKRLKRR